MKQRMLILITCLVVAGAAATFLAVKFQENLIFLPHKLSAHHVFKFDTSFKEIDLKTTDGKDVLNGVLFYSQLDTTNGVVLFFHGNSGNIQSWGGTSGLYTGLGYDILYYDYRGFGKSRGRISSEEQLIRDGELFYDYLKKIYGEKNLIVTGTSIGAGIASLVVKNKNPRALYLNAAFYSLQDLIQEKTLIIPDRMIRYKLLTNEVLPNLTCPIVLFHGDKDHLIPASHMQQLGKLNSTIKTHLLPRCGHNNIFNSDQFRQLMTAYLNQPTPMKETSPMDD